MCRPARAARATHDETITVRSRASAARCWRCPWSGFARPAAARQMCSANQRGEAQLKPNGPGGATGTEFSALRGRSSVVSTPSGSHLEPPRSARLRASRPESTRRTDRPWTWAGASSPHGADRDTRRGCVCAVRPGRSRANVRRMPTATDPRGCATAPITSFELERRTLARNPLPTSAPRDAHTQAGSGPSTAHPRRGAVLGSTGPRVPRLSPLASIARVKPSLPAPADADRCGVRTEMVGYPGRVPVAPSGNL